MSVISTTSDILGLEQQGHDLTFLQMCCRGIIVFASGLVMVRFAHKRFFAKKNAFDILLALVLGSTLGRAINGSERLFETIGVCFLLVLLHRLVSTAYRRFPRIEELVKGHANVLVEDGKVNEEVLNHHDVTMDDLKEDLRLMANLSDFDQVALACLERSGEISIVKKMPEPLPK